MPNAARVGDMQTCPQFNAQHQPHLGGPILPPGSTNVMIGGLPAARVTDTGSCVGSTATIISGSSTVFINGLPAARVGDPTDHGGSVIQGCPTVNIG